MYILPHLQGRRLTIAVRSYIEMIETPSGEVEARIAGTQITVQDIVIMYTVGDSPVDWIAENYDLNLAQIYAALSCYYDNKAEFDTTIRQRLERAQKLAQEIGTPLADVVKRMQSRQANN
jgi:uncharacterized protein (DUF433 family)